MRNMVSPLQCFSSAPPRVIYQRLPLVVVSVCSETASRGASSLVQTFSRLEYKVITTYDVLEVLISKALPLYEYST